MPMLENVARRLAQAGTRRCRRQACEGVGGKGLRRQCGKVPAAQAEL